MTFELTMPALSPTMEKGTLARWLVKPGDLVGAGDVLAEIETDKATMEFEAPAGGRVDELLVADGTGDVPVGAPLARLLPADAPPALPAAPPAPAAAAQPPAPPTPVPALAPEPAPAEDGAASPLARRIAAARGLSLASLAGSGPGGRIILADLGLRTGAAAPSAPAAAPAAPTPAAGVTPAPAIAPPPAEVPHEQVQLSAMRRTIARRLSASKQTVPHFHLSVRCRLDPLLRLRARINAELGGRGPRLSVNDFLVKALAVAAEREPQVNVQFAGDSVYRFGRVDVAVAIAVEGGLFTPVVRDAARLSVSAIARQMQDLGNRARAGRLLPEEYQGGTLSLSNLGMFGMDEMWPVINPPQAMILGVAAGVEQPWKVDGTVGLATIMTATAGFDHRAIDGADASRFMAAFRALVEDPLASML
jgi:pyruvate dehydrogenase E2 component (dihydrolipoamide acetyltransferase)